jgi:hypothetical protein
MAQPSVTLRVVICFVTVLSAIKFYDELFLQTHKIDDVISERLLAPKLAMIQPVRNEASAKVTARHRLGYAAIGGLSSVLGSYPLSFPFPARGKGIGWKQLVGQNSLRSARPR